MRNYISRVKDLTGQRFGRLEVISLKEERRIYSSQTKVVWICRCDCGKTKEVTSASLSSGTSTSCGCYSLELVTLPYGESSKNSVWTSYTGKAKKKNLEFSLTKEEFFKLTKENCFYCGTEPKNTYVRPRNNGGYLFNGIDRVDNKRGYTLENTVSCCKNCNYAKNILSQEDFFNMIKKIYERHFK
jgi:hypothetical protein